MNIFTNQSPNLTIISNPKLFLEVGEYELGCPHFFVVKSSNIVPFGPHDKRKQRCRKTQQMLGFSLPANCFPIKKGRRSTRLEPKYMLLINGFMRNRYQNFLQDVAELRGILTIDDFTAYFRTT